VGEKIFDNLNVAFTHFPEEAEFLVHPSEEFPKAEYSFIFYGHTHQPWEKTIDGVRLVNPGNVAGRPYLATFAVLDTDSKQLDLVMLDQLK
jgi:predicted phosphodiesterase